MFTGKQVLAIIPTGLILIILIQNSYAVRLKFLFLYFSLPLSILVLAVVLVGILIGYWLNRRKSHAPKR
ncbi:MAG: LapA family protein [candidate division Zixibacteria bacterium]|nr:LapA family protein [candidate division Zixibacteria bacterium]